jgi:hypothetical protein
MSRAYRVTAGITVAMLTVYAYVCVFIDTYYAAMP